jgi:hypothetical protein
MNGDVQAAGPEHVPDDVLARADAIEVEARAIAAATSAASQANATGAQDRTRIAALVESEPRRATIQAAGDVLGALAGIEAINEQLEYLVLDGRSAEDLAQLVLGESMKLVGKGAASLVGGPFAPLIGAAALGIGALIDAITGDTEERIEQYTDLREQQTMFLVQQAQLLATRAQNDTREMQAFVDSLSEDSRQAYYAEMARLTARDQAYMAEGRAPPIQIMPSTAEETVALATRSAGRTSFLQQSLRDDLAGFYEPPDLSQITAMGDPTSARLSLERQAMADAFVRARDYINGIYADVWWTSRFFERQLEALAAVRDRPTMVEREDPASPGAVIEIPATTALVQDERRMVTLHREMTAIHDQYGGIAACLVAS